MLFKEGGSREIWGRLLRTRIVADEREEAEATADGWMLRPDQHPLDHDGDGRKGGSRPRKEQRK